MSTVITWSDPIQQALSDVVRKRGIHGEIIRKAWPADRIVYVRLSADDGYEEWVLLDVDCGYEKAATMLDRPARRLQRGEAHGL